MLLVRDSVLITEVDSACSVTRGAKGPGFFNFLDHRRTTLTRGALGGRGTSFLLCNKCDRTRHMVLYYLPS